MSKAADRFNELLFSISRDGADVEGLNNCLKTKGFYTAPASTKYHSSFEGGLCLHSLMVYDILVDLVNSFCPNTYSDDTLKIVALLHDISKSNYYVREVKNKKVYSENGTKFDNIGKFDWVSYDAYTINDASNRGLFGTLEENSYYIVSQYIPLTLEESAAIINHCGGVEGSSSSMNRDLFEIFRRYPLVALLHTADFLASYVIEKKEDD